MAYTLGVDLGTTFTAAAVSRGGVVRVVDLGTKSAVVPSVLFLGDDELMLTGDAAARRASSDPGRVAREFKRRIGDPAPILLGGSPWSPQALLARMMRWTVDAVQEREGEPPEAIALSHPANWGPYKKDLLAEAIRLADLDVALSITEPEAAAISYSANERLPIGTVVAVYDLGGGTFDAAVLRKTADGFEILGEPEGVDRLGGVDFDAAVFRFVTTALNGAVEALDPNDPATLAALSHLRAECIDAKETLSADTETSVPVLLPNLHTEVRITRAELEAMIRPPLSDTIAALRRALRSAAVEPADVDVVLLVGGSSRIPLVAELVSNELGRPVAVDAHPKHAVAMGAALAAAEAPATTSSPAPPVTAPPAPPAAEAPPPSPVEREEATAPQPAAPDRPPQRVHDAEREPDQAPRHGPRRGVLAGVAAAALLVIAAVAALLLTGGNDNGASADAGATATACPASGTPAVCIETVSESDGNLLATFASHDVQLTEPVGGRFAAGTLHPVFFFQNSAPADGRVWGPSSPFGNPSADLPGFSAQDAPASTSALCVLLQDDTGRVFTGTGNCAPLPD